MLGDRVSSGDKTTQCQFLGAPATFPAGPVLLAAIMHCPVILFFGLYRGGKRYDIYFEHFAEEILCIAIVARKTFSIGCNAMPSGWSITRALRLTTGLIFTRSGINHRSVKVLKMVNDTPVNKAEIRTLIPHSGSMCLLDSVTEWDDRSINCISNTHRDPANPLRRDGRLSAVHAFEYAAQAAAVHGGLRARSVGVTAPPGYLAALRDAHLMRDASG